MPFRVQSQTENIKAENELYDCLRLHLLSSQRIWGFPIISSGSYSSRLIPAVQVTKQVKWDVKRLSIRVSWTVSKAECLLRRWSLGAVTRRVLRGAVKRQARAILCRFYGCFLCSFPPPPPRCSLYQRLSPRPLLLMQLSFNGNKICHPSKSI